VPARDAPAAEEGGREEKEGMTKKRGASKKRGAGEGSIYRRGDGRWCGSATIGRTDTGKQRRRVVYGKTRGEVAEKLRNLSNSVAEGNVAEPGRLRVADLVDRYLAAKKDSLRPRVHALYSSRLRVHVVPRIGGVTLRGLAPVHVLDLLAELQREEVGARTRQLVFDVLRRCLEFGVRVGLLPRNPARDLDRPQAKAPKVVSLSAEQAGRLLREAREGPTWVEAAVALGLCGLRRGETFGLAWRDVDLKAGRVRVRQALAELDDGTREVAPLKTKSARRELALPSWARAALRRHLESLAAAPHPTRLVFLTRAGTPVRLSNFVRRHLAPLTARAEVPGTTYHALRHTAATLLLAGGADPKSAQRVLGHAKAAHTLDIYADAVPERVDDAMALLDATLGV
jgi:integrase